MSGRCGVALWGLSLWSLGGFTACGPIQSSQALRQAQSALNAAHQANAQNLAPFETSAAEAYVEAARVRQSRSDHHVSIRYAQRATRCARVALERARAPEPETEPSLACPVRASMRTATSTPSP